MNMEIRMLREDELDNAAGLSRFVFDNCLRNRMEYPQTITFIEEYLESVHLKNLVQQQRLIIYGAFEQMQLVGVAGLQPDGMITMLYVLPQFWNRGIGSQLLVNMRRVAREQYALERVLLNATPAWTTGYFIKHGFAYLNGKTDMRAPFVPLVASTNPTLFASRRRIPKRYIVGAVAFCLLLATISTCLFMGWYLK